jgi:hypothetical protein
MFSAAILSTYKIESTNGPISPLDLKFEDLTARSVISLGTIANYLTLSSDDQAICNANSFHVTEHVDPFLRSHITAQTQVQ